MNSNRNQSDVSELQHTNSAHDVSRVAGQTSRDKDNNVWIVLALFQRIEVEELKQRNKSVTQRKCYGGYIIIDVNERKKKFLYLDENCR